MNYSGDSIPEDERRDKRNEAPRETRQREWNREGRDQDLDRPPRPYDDRRQQRPPAQPRDRDPRDWDRNRDRERHDRDRRDRDRNRDWRDNRDRDHRRYPDSRRGRDRNHHHNHHHDNRRRADYNNNRDWRDDRHSRRSISPWKGRKRRRDSPINLEGVVPINERPRHNSQWDVRPKGFEKVTTQMAKMSGLFPQPGQPRPVDTNKLQRLLNPDGTLKSGGGGANQRGGASGGGGAASALLQNTDEDSLKPSRSKVARRVLVSGYDPVKVIRQDLVRYFTELMTGLDLEMESNGPVVASSRELAGSSSTTLIDFATTEQATIAVALSGYAFDESNPTLGTLKVQRPGDYVVPEYVKTQRMVPDGPNKISVANIPPLVEEEQVKELLQAMGALKAFQLLRNKNGDSQGIAFCEYEDPALTEAVVQGLNGTDVGGNPLRVALATGGGTHLDEEIVKLSSHNIKRMIEKLLGSVPKEQQESSTTNVLQFFNMVTYEELAEDRDYREIVQDVTQECGKYGSVVDVKIPRPNPGTVGRVTTTLTLQTPGVGKVYVKFGSSDAARAALEKLNGRKFCDRTVVISFYPEMNFDLGVF